MDVTLSRGGESHTIPLLAQGGDLLISTDLGKPSLQVYDAGGALNPRFQDGFSSTETYNIIGRFKGDSAYSDAISLADFIKSPSGGTETTLDIPMGEFDDDIPVAPAAGQDTALSLGYPAGRRDNVDVDLGLTRVSITQGTGGGTQASTPTATGSGPIQVSRGGNTVDLTSDIQVERKVGRPNSKVSKSTRDYPTFIDHRKAAYDAFELSFVETDNVTSEIQALRDIFSPRLRSSPATISFNGIYGMGSFNVVPAGSQGLRHTRDAGYQGVSFVPTLNLRRVFG